MNVSGLSKPVNIYTTGFKADFMKGFWHISLLGGWNVSLNQFKIGLIDTSTKETTYCMPNLSLLKMNRFSHGRKAKTILNITIPKSCEYEVLFENQGTLIVKKSQLLFTSMLFGYVPNKSLEIVFD